jgi:hypothetical protein
LHSSSASYAPHTRHHNTSYPPRSRTRSWPRTCSLATDGLLRRALRVGRGCRACHPIMRASISIEIEIGIGGCGIVKRSMDGAKERGVGNVRGREQRIFGMVPFWHLQTRLCSCRPSSVGFPSRGLIF